MTILLLIPTVLSFLLLAAHFMFWGNLPLAVLSLLMPVLLFVKRAWVVRLLQVALLLAAAEWVFTLLNLIQDRQAEGRRWTAAAIILSSVALVNVAAAFLYRTHRLASRYRLVSQEPPSDDPRTSAQGV